MEIPYPVSVKARTDEEVLEALSRSDDFGMSAIHFIEHDFLKCAKGVYKIVDEKSGRYYVGSASVSFSKRFGHHEYRMKRGDHPNRTLQAIFNKDPSRLTYYIVWVAAAEASVADILSREQAHIDFALSNHVRRMLINELLVAGSHAGKKRSLLTRQRLSLANTGKIASPETRQKQREAKLGRKLTPEHIAKLILARTGKKINRTRNPPKTWERHHTDDEIRELRAMKASGLSYSAIEKIKGLSHGGLQKIILRQTYKEIA